MRVFCSISIAVGRMFFATTRLPWIPRSHIRGARTRYHAAPCAGVCVSLPLRVRHNGGLTCAMMYAILKCVMLECVMLECAMMHSMLDCVMLECAMMHSMLECVMLECAMMHSMLECVMLECVMLECVMLECVMLEYAMMHSMLECYILRTTWCM